MDSPQSQSQSQHSEINNGGKDSSDDNSDSRRTSISSLTNYLFRPFIQEPKKYVDWELDRHGQQQQEQQGFVGGGGGTAQWRVLGLVILSMIGLGVSLFLAVTAPATTVVSIRTSVAASVIWGVLVSYLILRRPKTGSVFVGLLCLGVFVVLVVELGGIKFSNHVLITGLILVQAVLAFMVLVVVLNMPLRLPFLSNNGISRPYTTPTKELRSPEDDLTLWQWMSVSWMAPLIAVGSKRQLNEEDVWFLAYEFQHSHLHQAFRRLSGTVVRKLIKANWIDLVVLTVLAIVELVAKMSGPLLLQQLLKAMEFVGLNKKPAIIYSGLILIVKLVAAQSGVFSLWFARRCYERSRGEMITMLHEKVLHRKNIGSKPDSLTEKIDPAIGNNDNEANGHIDENDEDSETDGLLTGKQESKRESWARVRNFMSAIGFCFTPGRQKAKAREKQPASMGKILNLMRNDVYETAQRFWEFQNLINKPLGLIISTILLYRLIGWSTFVAIGVVVAAQVINALLARMLYKWEQIRREATDHKLQQITQYVEAIRHLRWYGWHFSMLENVMSARQKELNMKIITNLWTIFINFVNVSALLVYSIAAFWAYTALAGHQLRIDIAFPALSLFQMLESTIREIPNLITVFLNAAVAVGRIEDFMSEPEVEDNHTAQFDNRLELSKASFAWPGTTEPVLKNITLSFPQGLTVISGPVGSGKSALLQALLGELDHVDGELTRPDAAIAYCSQSPWLQSMKIRENILFGDLYDEARYKQVLEACALLPDLASFEQGDLSPIGENGIGLSGGQKARVALARALYSRAKYLLLDDPLSALDQHTAESIVSMCFKSDLLKDRTTILVTHRVDLCQGLAEQIVHMENGIAQSRADVAGAIDTLDYTAQKENLPEQAKEAQESAAIREKFEDEEYRAHGGVQLKVYWEYIKAGQLKWWAGTLISCLGIRVFYYCQMWFLKELGEAYHTSDALKLVLTRTYEYSFHVWSTPLSRFFDKYPDPSVNVTPWLLGLLAIAGIIAVFYLLLQIFMMIVTYTAGKSMFQDIMVSISNATFHFYDVTPVGRLMNRLTGDVGTVDGQISNLFLVIAANIFGWLGALVVIASITPIFFVFAVALAAAFVYYFFHFLPTSQSLRRLEMVSLSPLMSNFGALLNGLVTVRAFHAQTQFQNRVIAVTDIFQGMDHFYWSLQGWLMYRFDNLSAVSTFILSLLAIYSDLTTGLTAFVLVAAEDFVANTHSLCKIYGQLQLDFVAVERVVELLHLEQEDAGTVDPPASWPSAKGSIEFEDVTVRYAPHLDPALTNISFEIPGGSNTAIIGRTGSGKSTLALSLLATMRPESGRILIDGIDISRVSKQALRTRVTFLAQDPILFPGTLRSNLDPLREHGDAACSDVLSRVGGAKYSWTLDTSVEAGGKNLSQGQRQLVGLARAILRRSSIVIMDEATASIDYETSFEVQRALKDELAGSTVITIAHRASAVQGVDWVCKLDNGKLSSFEKAANADAE